MAASPRARTLDGLAQVRAHATCVPRDPLARRAGEIEPPIAMRPETNPPWGVTAALVMPSIAATGNSVLCSCTALAASNAARIGSAVARPSSRVEPSASISTAPRPVSSATRPGVTIAPRRSMRRASAGARAASSGPPTAAMRVPRSSITASCTRRPSLRSSAPTSRIGGPS
ncbi:MAG: hypothetical protein U0168_31315 [Nannocystaceae bacterium]